MRLLPPYPFPFQAATAIILNNKKQYLLLKRSKSSKSFRHYWQLPEGKINSGEDPKQTLVRELKEEIGLDINQSELKFFKKIDILSSKYGLPFFKITRHVYFAPAVDKIILSKEHEEYGFFSLEEIEKLPNKLPGLLEIIKDE